ncbi:MAG TPA: DUF2147 domain-containing protein [Ideonella sp.]|uniref:DUF2147 domain-containing protein n=1 Tax=Ideonella sp. TaxID=1929293 RepID=UPI002E2F799C|nr:DUF2147 domain-containing protein [Ideonella sp.]HEX5685513.1 DUF2147 domain-containing protein [Ideonella sp.]
MASASALAQSASPAGLWKTIDDGSKKEKSLVRITDTGGVLSGKIEKLLDPNEKPDVVCDQCSDDRKNQPVVGLTIIRGVKQDADDKTLWNGGDILDPANGKVYKVRLKPAQDGKALEVRGFIGMPMFGRSQTWIRVE